MFHPTIANNAWPAAVSFHLSSVRRQQVFFRSQFFYCGRILLGPAPLPDKLSRIQRRWFADLLGLLYDWSEGQQRCLAAYHLPDPNCQRWLVSCQQAQRHGMDGLVQLGRACVASGAG